MQHAVCRRHVQQALEHILQQLPVVLEQRRDLVGVGLVAGHILLGQVEDALDVGRLRRATHWKIFRKASTSSGETTPSALAILADSAMTPMVKATSFSGSPPFRSSPKTCAKSPSRPPPASPTAAAKPEIFCQTVMRLLPSPSHLPHAGSDCIAAHQTANPENAEECQGNTMEPSATDEVLIRREGRAGRITMNRPKALNALTYGMVGRIWDALVAWRDDPAVELVLLDGAGDRALCAGGDVRSLLRQPRRRAPALPARSGATSTGSTR